VDYEQPSSKLINFSPFNYSPREYPGLPLVVNGHSLGGALAVLAAIDIVNQLGIDVTLYTYGRKEFN
jgi:hypothetical protein